MITETETLNDAAEVEDEAQVARRMDPELRTLGALLRMIENLEEPARGRVVAYLSSRYSSGGRS